MASMKKVAWPGVMRWALALACTCAAAPSVATPGPGLQVLHWWTSTGERKAADLLAARLADEGVAWQDAAIPGGAGLGAGKVLKGRVLAGDAPEVTQLIGPWIAEREVKVLPPSLLSNADSIPFGSGVAADVYREETRGGAVA